MEGVLIELPVLLALSANSPFWRGEHTGLASSRAMIFSAFPRSGLPPRFADYQDYAEAVGFMEATGAIGDYTHLWWDVRPHPRFGTIEVRVMDCQTRLEDTIALAAYVQCLVKLLLDRYDDGQVLSYHRMLLSENKWLALRYGLDAPLMDLAAGKRMKMAARTLARAPDPRAAPDRARPGLRRRARPDRLDPRERQRRRPPAPGLEREPGHRRGGRGDRLGRRARLDLPGRLARSPSRRYISRAKGFLAKGYDANYGYTNDAEEG